MVDLFHTLSVSLSRRIHLCFKKPWHTLCLFLGVHLQSIFYQQDTSIYTFSLPLILFRVVSGWSLSQLHLGERRRTPWTGHQSVTGLTQTDTQPFMHTNTATGNLELPVDLVSMILDCGREPTHAHSTQKGKLRGCSPNRIPWNTQMQCG